MKIKQIVIVFLVIIINTQNILAETNDSPTHDIVMKTVLDGYRKEAHIRTTKELSLRRIQGYEEEILANPDDFNLYLKYAKYHMSKFKNYEEAKVILSKGLKKLFYRYKDEKHSGVLDTQSYLFYVHRGICYKRLGDSANAVKDFKTAIALLEKSSDLVADLLVINKWPDAYMQLFEIYVPMKDHYEEAIALGKRILNLRPESNLEFSIAMMYKNKKDYTSAISWFKKALKKDSISKGFIYLCMGGVYEQIEEYIEAIDYYTKVLEYPEEKAFAYLSRGVCYSKLNYYEKAFADLKEAIKLKPNNAVFLQKQQEIENAYALEEKVMTENGIKVDVTLPWNFDSSNAVKKNNKTPTIDIGDNEWKEIENPLNKLVKGHILSKKSGKGVFLLKGNKYKKIGIYNNPCFTLRGDKFAVTYLPRSMEKEIIVFDKNGKLLEKIKTPHAVHDMAWFPSGEQIAYTAGKNIDILGELGLGSGTYPHPEPIYMYIYLYSLKTKKSHLIYMLDFSSMPMESWLTTKIFDISVSPNGKYIKFFEFGQKTQALHVINIEGNLIYSKDENYFDDFTFAWLPDSKHLIGKRNRNKLDSLHKINVETSEITELKDLKIPFQAYKAVVTPDGKYYYASNLHNREYTYVLHLQGKHKGKISLLLDEYYAANWYYDKDDFKWDFEQDEKFFKELQDKS